MLKKLILIITLVMGLFIPDAFPIAANTTESVIVLKKKAKSQQTKSATLIIKACIDDNSLTIYFLSPLKEVNITIKDEFGNIAHSEQQLINEPSNVYIDIQGLSEGEYTLEIETLQGDFEGKFSVK